FLFVKSLSPLSWIKFPAMMGAYALAWTVGFLSVITPSGLGVREGILSLLLAVYMPTATATLVALLSRIWSTMAELVLVGVAVFFRGKRTNEFVTTMTKSLTIQNAMKNRYLEKLGSQEHLQERQGRAELIASILSKELKKSALIVDVGAGNGLIRQCLSEKFKKRILGVEHQLEFVKIKEDIFIADALQLPFRTTAVDLMLLNNVVEHIFEKKRLFCEIWRVLKPDGFVYLTTGSPFQLMEPHYKLPFLSWLPKPLADRYVRWTRRGTSYQHVKFVSYFRLLNLANRSGFSVSDITAHVLKHHGQLLQSRYQKYLRLVRFLPDKFLNPLLHLFSPQWFILLRKQVN
ncbi:TPA: methyltransferase domain-containing protein, partial [Candidatus Poribacteria bacterium]|nr:methyltransferase domain-containing protein [Candidatus Poribacteria bacterium]